MWYRIYQPNAQCSMTWRWITLPIQGIWKVSTTFYVYWRWEIFNAGLESQALHQTSKARDVIWLQNSAGVTKGKWLENDWSQANSQPMKWSNYILQVCSGCWNHTMLVLSLNVCNTIESFVLAGQIWPRTRTLLPIHSLWMVSNTFDMFEQDVGVIPCKSGASTAVPLCHGIV